MNSNTLEYAVLIIIMLIVALYLSLELQSCASEVLNKSTETTIKVTL